jgi:hypothetical protein
MIIMVGTFLEIFLPLAVESNKVSEAQLDEALSHLFSVQVYRIVVS